MSTDFLFDEAAPANEDEEALFLDRLELFLERSLDEFRHFAEREGRDFLQIRLSAARWHSKFLFEYEKQHNNANESNIQTSVKEQIEDVLTNVSNTLESLCEATGQHSFMLVVDPKDESNDGFLGGTGLGCEYWRGLRNGGASGVRNFKEYCRSVSKNQVILPITINTQPLTQRSGPRSSPSAPSTVLKNHLYTEMRSRLRSVSGIRNAEMKWSKPENLAVYGVVLIGWPTNIGYKNPSQMSSHERSTVMRLLEENKLYFRLIGDGSTIHDSFMSSHLEGDVTQSN